MHTIQLARAIHPLADSLSHSPSTLSSTKMVPLFPREMRTRDERYVT